VSPSTVSRALAGLPSVSPATQRRVRELARSLNFRLNILAAGLRKGRTGVIGVIVPRLTGHFFPEVLHSITATAGKAKLRVIICESNEDEQEEQQQLFWLLTAQVDGLLVSVARATRNTCHFETARQQGVPVVFFDQAIDCPSVNSVVLDNYQGAYDGVSHLIAQGRTRIAHLAGPQHLAVFRDRQRGYADALRAHLLPPDKRLVRTGSLTLAAGRQHMLGLLAGPVVPDAVFASQELLAIGAMRAIKARGSRIPADVALAGFAGETVAALAEPALTSIDQQSTEVGKAAVRLLLKLLANPTRAPQCVSLVPKLLIRDSSAAPLAAVAGPLSFAKPKHTVLEPAGRGPAGPAAGYRRG